MRTLLPLLLLAAACTGTVEVKTANSPPTPPTPPTPAQTAKDPRAAADVLAAVLMPKGRSHEPAGIALAAEPQPPKPVPTVRDVERSLSRNAELAPVVEALGNAGLSDREMAELIAMAGAYNSNTAADPAAKRHRDARARMVGELSKLDSALSKAEAASQVKVDRVRLWQRLYAPEPEVGTLFEEDGR